MAFQKVPANVAAQLTLDEDSLINQLRTLESVLGNTSAAPIVVRKMAGILLEQIIDRVERKVPNQGRPLPKPYVRLPLPVCEVCGARKLDEESDCNECWERDRV